MFLLKKKEKYVDLLHIWIVVPSCKKCCCNCQELARGKSILSSLVYFCFLFLKMSKSSFF